MLLLLLLVQAQGQGESETVKGEWLVGQWIVGVISFQKIFGFCGLKGDIGKTMYDATLVHDDGRTECEDRILDSDFAKLEQWESEAVVG